MARATLKLFALLGARLPPGSKGNCAEIEIGAGATVADILGGQNLTEAECHLVLLNGVFVPREARAATPVADGDAVSVWPPIGGG